MLSISCMLAILCANDLIHLSKIKNYRYHFVWRNRSFGQEGFIVCVLQINWKIDNDLSQFFVRTRKDCLNHDGVFQSISSGLFQTLKSDEGGR